MLMLTVGFLPLANFGSYVTSVTTFRRSQIVLLYRRYVYM